MLTHFSHLSQRHCSTFVPKTQRSPQSRTRSHMATIRWGKLSRRREVRLRRNWRAAREARARARCQAGPLAKLAEKRMPRAAKARSSSTMELSSEGGLRDAQGEPFLYGAMARRRKPWTACWRTTTDGAGPDWCGVESGAGGWWSWDERGVVAGTGWAGEADGDVLVSPARVAGIGV